MDEGFIYTPSGASSTYAELFTRKGDVLNRWHEADFTRPRVMNNPRYLRGWNHVRYIPDKQCLLAIIPLQGMLALDNDSSPLWFSPGFFHHEIVQIHGFLGGGYLTLEDRPSIITFEDGSSQHILDNSVVLLDGNGSRLREWSLLEMLPQKARMQLISSLEVATSQPECRSAWDLTGFMSVEDNIICRDAGCDVIHANSIFVTSDTSSSCTLVVSLRNIDSIITVDLADKLGTEAWIHPGASQHTASVTSTGELLYLSNNPSRGESHVVRVNAARTESEIVYGGHADNIFSCPHAGNVQALSPGVYLLGNSHAGWAREFDSEGRPTFEWHCPIDPVTGGRTHFYRLECVWW